jgi:hypothetical protein
LSLRPEREKVHRVVDTCSGCDRNPGNSPGRKNQEAAVQVEVKDNGRKWFWGFLAVLVMSQIYFVLELLAAFSLFLVGFAAIALLVVIFYTLENCWKLAMARLANLRQPVLNMASVSRENQKAA